MAKTKQLNILRSRRILMLIDHFFYLVHHIFFLIINFPLSKKASDGYITKKRPRN